MNLIKIDTILKFYVKYETYCDLGHRKSMHLYARNENEFYANLYKLMEFPIFKEITKSGISLEIYRTPIKFKTSELNQNEDAYFYWFNRKYYEIDSQFKNIILKSFEDLEEYEICKIIYDNY